jgi:hypothetical protein
MPKGKNLKRCPNYATLPEDESFCNCRVCTKLDGELHFKNGELIEVYCRNRKMDDSIPAPDEPEPNAKEWGLSLNRIITWR